MIDTDLSTLGQYLKNNKDGLVTKGVASVRSPVTRLREASFTVDHLSFCDATRTEFLKRYAYDQWRQNEEREVSLFFFVLKERRLDDSFTLFL